MGLSYPGYWPLAGLNPLLFPQDWLLKPEKSKILKNLPAEFHCPDFAMSHFGSPPKCFQYCSESHNWQMLSSRRLAVVVLYSYKDDYYKILLWKPAWFNWPWKRPSRLSQVPETVSILGPAESAWGLTDSYLFHLESERPTDTNRLFFTVLNGDPKSITFWKPLLWTSGSLDFDALIGQRKLKYRGLFTED